jgi:hypothetical protein
VRSSFQGPPEAMRFGRFQSKGNVHNRDGDRRLPMMKPIREGESVSEDVQARRFVCEDERIDGWDHVQYLGERMVCRYPLM